MNFSFSIGSPHLLGVPLYLFFYFLGTILSLVVGWVLIRRLPALQDVRYFDLLWATWILGLLGAKATSIVLSPYGLNELVEKVGWLYILEGGYYLYGAFLVGIGVFFGLIWLWRPRVQLWPALQLMMLVLPLGLGIGRLGCIFAGCCFGPVANPDHVHWVMLFHYGPEYGPLSAGPRVALQLYNVLLLGVVTVLIWTGAIWQKWRMTHFHEVAPSLLIFTLMFGIFRFYESKLRDPISRVDNPFLGLLFNEWVSLCLIIISIIVGVAWWRAKKCMNSKG